MGATDSKNTQQKQSEERAANLTPVTAFSMDGMLGNNEERSKFDETVANLIIKSLKERRAFSSDLFDYIYSHPKYKDTIKMELMQCLKTILKPPIEGVSWHWFSKFILPLNVWFNQDYTFEINTKNDKKKNENNNETTLLYDELIDIATIYMRHESNKMDEIYNAMLKDEFGEKISQNTYG